MGRIDPRLTPFVCLNCGFWQRHFDVPPDCPVCTDYRHPLPADGWRFLSAAEVADSHRTTWREVLDGVWMLEAEPAIGIGPAGWFIETEHGNVHWEGAGWTDDAALDWMASKGGVRFLAFSHAHVLGSAWRVSERFAPEAVVQNDQLPWAQALAVSWPFGTSAPLADGLSLVHTGGHTPGHTVLHWQARQLVFCGDAFKFKLDADGRATHVSTHKAYDGHIPLSHDDARSYRDTFGALDFDGIVTPWEAVPEGGKAAAMHLLDVQLADRPTADWVEIPDGPLPAAAAQNANVSVAAGRQQALHSAL
ncbi:MAG: MBL fold metallo-hydrolase [Bacteroidota bacterium]